MMYPMKRVVRRINAWKRGNGRRDLPGIEADNPEIIPLKGFAAVATPSTLQP